MVSFGRWIHLVDNFHSRRHKSDTSLVHFDRYLSGVKSELHTGLIKFGLTLKSFLLT